MINKASITVSTLINAPIEKVWTVWTNPEHIMKWNAASDDWMTAKVENDLRAGGKFLSRMEAKDGSFGFDFEGIYDEVEINKLLTYSLADNRKVSISFSAESNQTLVTEVFEPEEENAVEMQQAGWQSILNNFKKYTEELEQ